MKSVRVPMVLAALAAMSACVPKPVAPPPAPEPAPRPAPAPAPAPPPADWRDLPLTPGGWVYASEAADSQARFGASAPSFTVRCDRASRQIILTREGAAAGAMTIRTSFGARSFPTSSARIGARDPILDSMAFSRGRFTVQVPGTAMLVIPSWPEPARVIEDCRA